MSIILDTSFLYAVNDVDDEHHLATVNFLRSLEQVQMYLPTPVLPELSYLLHSRLGHRAMRRFISGLANSTIELLMLNQADLYRISELLETYADAALDFTDAAIIALAERFDVRQIATFDHRDFSLVRPKHCSSFKLLP